ncbi:MAG TPA: radical SAM protein, partial [bacterium]|nr:radical SAM protein [bacterium]
MNLKKILKPNFIKAGLKSLTANILKDYKTPIGVYLTITSRCNLNCKCCDFQKINQKKILEIPTENCIEYIRQMADAGVVKLNITGGEPLLHKGIDEIIKFAKSKKMFIALSTNATKISEHLDALKFVDVVMMSFDGSPKNHNYLRGADNFETLIKTIELLKKNNINFWTTTTLNKKNINDIEFVLSIAKKYNTYANFVLIQFFDKVIESNSLPDYQKVQQLELIPDDKDIRAAFEKLIKLKKDGEPIGSSFEFL